MKVDAHAFTSSWLDAFVEEAVRAGAPPDFVSSHLYPTDPWAHEEALSHGRDDFIGAIAGKKLTLPRCCCGLCVFSRVICAQG